MEITESQFEKVKHLPRQRGNVRHDSRTLLNGMLYVLENGCKWRALPEGSGRGTRFTSAAAGGPGRAFWPRFSTGCAKPG